MCIKHIHNIDTHIHTRASSPRTPSGKSSLVFIIWFQIRAQAFTVHMGEGNKQQLLLFPCSVCPHHSHVLKFRLPKSSLSRLMLMRLKETSPFLFCLRTARFIFLYLCVCSALGCTLPLFSQRIRHAECWGPLHTSDWGEEERDLSVDCSALIGYQI